MPCHLPLVLHQLRVALEGIDHFFRVVPRLLEGVGTDFSWARRARSPTSPRVAFWMVSSRQSFTSRMSRPRQRVEHDEVGVATA
jgi:hypothetical protein